VRATYHGCLPKEGVSECRPIAAAYASTLTAETICFDGPSVAEDNTQITCRACKHVTTIKEADAFGKAKPANGQIRT
jgi:hypothetical protein